VERSVRTDSGELSPNDHAGDLAAVIEALDAGPVEIFASSGGAVNALALAAQRPDLIRTLVAHEPPSAGLVPDRDAALAAVEDIHQAYQRDGMGAGMAKFIALVGFEGEIPADYTDRPAPDPAMFGLATEDDGSRTDPLMRNVPACNAYRPDLEALGALGDRLVLAAGLESGEQMAARGARSVAEALGRPVAEFPSHHGGFLGGEFGQQGDPVAFAAALHARLD
jgi:pimeloyl-ACP methyl ester carboxylesterase